MSTPPPLPATQNKLRLATVLNLSVPGAGLYYLGRRKLGATLAIAFLGCFVAAMALFVIGYSRYLSFAMSDHLLEGDNIEQAGRAFPRVSLAVLAIVGAAIYLYSTLLLKGAQRRLAVPRAPANSSSSTKSKPPSLPPP